MEDDKTKPVDAENSTHSVNAADDDNPFTDAMRRVEVSRIVQAILSEPQPASDDDDDDDGDLVLSVEGVSAWLEAASKVLKNERAEAIADTEREREAAILDDIEAAAHGAYEERPPTIRQQVREFRTAFGLTCPDVPAMPDDNNIRLAMALIVEEFLETISAAFESPLHIRDAKRALARVVDMSPIKVSLPDLADGLADLAYVTEGAAQTFGINSDLVNAEVHRSNMAKANGPRSETGKILKPAGWTPPDIEGVLKAQGWKPETP